MSASIETALSYAALILADADVEITPEKLSTLTNKAGVHVDKIWTDLYAKALDGKDLFGLLTQFSASAAVGGGATVSTGATGGAVAEDEAAKESESEEEEESDDDMGFGLF
ncbi:ribosomal protein P1, partial [Ascoidea rubescens DSM 1968]